MARRARTELMFQEAILSVDGMAMRLTGRVRAVDFAGGCGGSPKVKAPAPGAWSGGQPGVLREGDHGARTGQQGENPMKPRNRNMFSIDPFLSRG